MQRDIGLIWNQIWYNCWFFFLVVLNFFILAPNPCCCLLQVFAALVFSFYSVFFDLLIRSQILDIQFYSLTYIEMVWSPFCDRRNGVATGLERWKKARRQGDWGAVTTVSVGAVTKRKLGWGSSRLALWGAKSAVMSWCVSFPANFEDMMKKVFHSYGTLLCFDNVFVYLQSQI